MPDTVDVQRFGAAPRQTGTIGIVVDLTEKMSAHIVALAALPFRPQRRNVDGCHNDLLSRYEIGNVLGEGWAVDPAVPSFAFTPEEGVLYDPLDDMRNLIAKPFT